MTLFIIRVFMFTILPVLAAALVVRFDAHADTRKKKLEIYLLYLFGLGVAGSGISGWFGHLFLSDIVAEGIGWEPGSPFQLEMGFANLALGVLGLIATARRDGFREATVVAVTVIGVGATIVHLIDIAETGNLAPGNTIQNIANLARPALLIFFLRASRKAEDAEPMDGRWYVTHGQAVGWLTSLATTGFGVGFAFGAPAAGVTLGILAGAIFVWISLQRLRAMPS
ncbi:MAG: hypothetical protein DWQ07_15955 [Chloroflexi bacterium]|nr:MAG: hypothetical protein DWQ07_15955 [Chloroflexota bacterium]MBL1195245.1 hypothetical protein [Chloroflexota bacterium]NOH12531.1 hypothetical protein [Chloroflexota bacterium]